MTSARALIAEESGVIVTDAVRAAARCAAERRGRGRVGGLRERGASARRSSRCCSRRCAREDGSTMHALSSTRSSTRCVRTRCSSAAPRSSMSRAPGRLDVMGGIADYSGSLVLQRPIAEATFAAVQRIDRPRAGDRQPRPHAVHDPARHAARRAACRSATRRRGGCSTACSRTHWAAYIAGVVPRPRARARAAADVGRENRRRRRTCPRARA